MRIGETEEEEQGDGGRGGGGALVGATKGSRIIYANISVSKKIYVIAISKCVQFVEILYHPLYFDVFIRHLS